MAFADNSRGGVECAVVIVGIVLTSIDVVYGVYLAVRWLRATCFSGTATQQQQPSPPSTQAVQMGPVPVALELQPVSPRMLASLPIREFSAECGEQIVECAICLSDYTVDDQFWQLPACRHHFHVACLTRWFQSHSTCPYCRLAV